MSKLTELTIAESLEKLSKKEISATELTKAYVEAMVSNKGLNAFVAETAEKALEQAKVSDEKYAKGTNGALEGIPLGIKDNFCTKGIHSQACSKILKDFKPEYESTITQKLLDAGASFLGKLNMDELAMGGSNETSVYGPARNPWKNDYVPGGSSGGSAAAVAANMCAAATGTDTGGSIRQPASFCGVTGIKPTYGLCSRYGVMAFASSLDQAGPITKDVRDAALMLNVMAGHDKRDATSVDFKVPNYTMFLNQDVKGMKLGIPKGFGYEESGTWERCAKKFEEMGVEIVFVDMPNLQHALPAYYIIAPAEASSNLARYDGVKYGLRVNGDGLDDMYANTRTEGFGAEVKRRIMIGTYVLSAGYYDAYYLKAQKIRRLIRDDFVKAFRNVDAILTPTTPTSAFPIGFHENEDPIKMYLNDIYTVSVNLAGLPAISVPFELENGLPRGMQLIGKAFDERTLFKLAYALELKADFKRL